MTTLKLENATPHDVLAYLTLGATPGCAQEVADLVLTPSLPLTRVAALMGFLVLPARATVEIAAPTGLGLNGNFSFDTPPLNCPCPEFPEGVNLAEFILNNGFQPGGQETVDISCVCGANAMVRIELEADDWTANGGAIDVASIRNGTRYENTGRVGVFPYGCDDCTASDAPPSCVGRHPEYANAEPICTVQRPASGNFGGSVRVIFDGYAPVPA